MKVFCPFPFGFVMKLFYDKNHEDTKNFIKNLKLINKNIKCLTIENIIFVIEEYINNMTKLFYEHKTKYKLIRVQNQNHQ